MGPLTGYYVLACENGLAGPLCSRLLADLGADVVKVERPGSGDVTREWDTGAAGLATGFVWMNRGKRSVALDLKTESGRVAIELLIERCDVFLQNFAPDWAKRMRLDEPSVRSLKPDVVYVEITGYGSDGPYYPHFYWHRGETPGRHGLRHPLFCPYGPYRAMGDRWFNLAVLSSEHWRAFCADVIERSQLLDDPRYGSMEERVAHRAELEPYLERVFAGRTPEQWVERLELAGIPCGLVRGFDEVMRHPQLEHNGLVTEVCSPVGVIPTIGSPIELDGTRPELGPVPALGEHTREVLAEVGMSESEIAELDRAPA